jgi:hypothetical protein
VTLVKLWPFASVIMGTLTVISSVVTYYADGGFLPFVTAPVGALVIAGGFWSLSRVRRADAL